MKGLFAGLAALVALGLLFFFYTARTAPPEATVGLEANKQVVRDVYAAIDAQDYDKIRSLVAEDATGGIIGTQEMIPFEGMVEMIQMFYAAFPDYTHVVDGMIAEGDWVAVRLTFHATHQGEFQGISASGNAVTYGGAHFQRVVDGLIQESWILENDLSLMEQIGLQLGPAGEG
jgi:predicted ester cyclase